MSDETGEQLELVPARTSGRTPRKRPAKPPVEAAEVIPVARVAVDTGLAHLDRPFDYLVPATLDADVVVGCRVKVRFAGRLADGFVVDRVAVSGHGGRLAFVAKVVSPEPVLVPEVLHLARLVADRWAGTLHDVLRLAIPPRHARTEASDTAVEPGPLPDPPSSGWSPYVEGPSFVDALAAGESPRGWWSAVPTHPPARVVAEAVRHVLASGRGAVVCVPDARDVEQWHAAFTEVLGEGRHVVLTAAQTPAERYRSFLRLRRGQVQVVLGTRAAAFAPVAHLGLVALWDDGDDLYVEPRAPYAHAREVLLTRATEADCAVLMGGYARTAEGQSLVRGGWAREIAPDATVRRAAWPRLDVTDGSVAGGAPARLPHAVFAAIRAADGPVLVQVPRRGYRSSLACQDCRTPARCRVCEGPLAQSRADAPVACRWCHAEESPWTCRECGSHRLRAPVVGQLRTAEEYARAFPDREVVTSGGGSVLTAAPGDRAVVLATPGAEPPAEGGYALVVLMDTWLVLGRDDVRVEEEAHRRWLNALALGRPGGAAVAVGDPAALQGIVRADAAGMAERELADRTATRLPPVARLVTLDGDAETVAALAARAWTPLTEVLGPVPHGPDDAERLILRAPRREGAALSSLLREVAAERSAAKLPGVRIQVDPPSF